MKPRPSRFFSPTSTPGIKPGDLVTFAPGIMARHATAHIAVKGKGGVVVLRYVGRARRPRKTSS